VREVERRAAGAGGGMGGVGGGGDGVIGAWVSELLARADESMAQLTPAAPAATARGGGVSPEVEELVELRRVVKTLKRSVDGILGGEGLLGVSLFR
jgi:nuclear pore complex protein Nup155